jgi:hypothetical protein
VKQLLFGHDICSSCLLLQAAVCSLLVIIVPTISLIIAEKFSDGCKHNVRNISILSMAIVPSQEIVYYHKLRKIQRATASIQTSLSDGVSEQICRRNTKGEHKFYAPTRLGQQIFHQVSHHEVEKDCSCDP